MKKVSDIIKKYEEIIVRVEQIPDNEILKEVKILEFNDLVDLEQ